MAFDKPAVVIDNGSYYTKVGFACDNHPLSIFRTVVGRPSYLQGSYGRHYYDVLIGDEAVAVSDDLDLSQPVVKGRINHWDNMERIWHHTFYRELKAAPEDRAVMLACSTNLTLEDKVKCCEVFFETLNAPALCIQSQSALALYGSGYTTGISVDIGYDTTDINPVYEGGPICYAHMTTGLAASQLSQHIKQCLYERNLDFGIKTPHVLEDVIKMLYVTQNCAMSWKNWSKKYKLPDGNELEVGHETFMTAEMLFQPDLVLSTESEFMSLQAAVVTAALKCDAELRPELYDAVVLCGGLAMIPGLSERLGTEIEAISGRPVNILSSSEAYAVSWLGGATFAGISEAQKMWITKKQFEDYGLRIVRNKFM